MLKKALMIVISVIMILAIGMSMAYAKEFDYTQPMYFGEETDFGEGVHVIADQLGGVRSGESSSMYSIRMAGNIRFELCDETPMEAEVFPGNHWGSPIMGYYYRINVSPACLSSVDGSAIGEVVDYLVIEGLCPGKKPIGLDVHSGAGTLEEPYELLILYEDGYSVPKPELVNSDVSVRLNGQVLEFDQPPVVVGNRTLVPLRAIFEAMGASVDWIQETQTVVAVCGDITLSFQIGDSIMYKNSTPIELDVSAQVVNDRTLVPLRAVSKAFGAKVNWENSTRTVTIDY